VCGERTTRRRCSTLVGEPDPPIEARGRMDVEQSASHPQFTAQIGGAGVYVITS
jgi:hypothetical protein